MRVYKFGGASVKDAAGVRNVASILQAESETEFDDCDFCYGQNNQRLRSNSKRLLQRRYTFFRFSKTISL